MGQWTAKSRLAKVVDQAGFEYDAAQDIIVSKLWPYQRFAGYNWLYDVASPLLHMIIDCEPFYFDYGGHAWLIELWKGQYWIEAGAEIGLYRDRRPVDQHKAPPRTRHYDCPPNDLALPLMSFTLHKRDAGGDSKLLLRRGPEYHWWLTGFRWGEYVAKSNDLTMKLEIRFHDDWLPFSAPGERRPGAGRGLRDAFMASVKARGYGVSAVGALGLSFTFARPRSQQPQSRLELEPSVQRKNGELVVAYNALRRALNIPNNDPNAFDQLDAPTDEAVQAIKATAAKVQAAASSLAGKLPAKPPVGAKLGTKLSGSGTARAAGSAVAGKLHGAADALATKLGGELPGGAMAAYDALFDFHDRKVWHLQAATPAA